MMSTSALSQIETACADAVAGLLAHEGAAAGGDQAAPPPVEQPPRSQPRLAVPECGSPWVRKNVGIDIPAAASISISAWRNGSATGGQPRPMVTCRRPSCRQHDRTPSQSRRDVGLLGGARLCRGGVSDIENSAVLRACPRLHTITTPLTPRQRLLPRRWEHVG